MPLPHDTGDQCSQCTPHISAVLCFVCRHYQMIGCKTVQTRVCLLLTVKADPLLNVVDLLCCCCMCIVRCLFLLCSTRRRVPVRTRAEVDFDFGVSPVGSPPTVVHLMLRNDGDTPTEWYVCM